MKIHVHIQQPKISVKIKSGIRETLAIGAGTGDMRKSVYDQNENGVVDDSEKLGGQLPSYYATATNLATAYAAAVAAQNSIAAHAALTNNPHTTTLEQTRAAANAIIGAIIGTGLHASNSVDLNNTDYGLSASVLKSGNGVVVVQDGRVLITDAANLAGILVDTVNLTVEMFNDYGSFKLNADGTLSTAGSRLRDLPAAVATDEPVRLQEFNTEIAAINSAMNTIGRVRGAIDFSTNPLLPASIRGDRWEASVAGLAGGALGQPMQVWDELVCLNDSPGGTWAAQGTNFYIVQGNADQATELLLGMLKIATQILANAETDDTTAISPAKLGAWRIAKLGNVTNDAQLKIASNLSDLQNAATARTNLGLGDSATKNTGTTAGTVAAGDDSRFPQQTSWTSWTSTLGGFSGTPTQTCTYIQMGKTVICEITINGTSNATTFTLTLPVAALSRIAYFGDSQNAGSRTNGVLKTRAGSTTADAYINMAEAGWTNSGTKELRITITYQAA